MTDAKENNGEEVPTAQPGAVVMPAAAEPAPTPAPQPTPESPDNQPPTSQTTGDGQSVSWTASEFVAHDKGAGWYLGLLLVTAAAAALVYLATRDAITSVVVVVAGVVLTGYGARRPREIQYHLDTSGVTVGDKHFLYETFRSFSVIPEGAFSSIVFVPHRRFALPLTLYYAPDDEDRIVNLLADRLPLEEGRQDVVDNLMRRIRF